MNDGKASVPPSTASGLGAGAAQAVDRDRQGEGDVVQRQIPIVVRRFERRDRAFVQQPAPGLRGRLARASAPPGGCPDAQAARGQRHDVAVDKRHELTQLQLAEIAPPSVQERRDIINQHADRRKRGEAGAVAKEGLPRIALQCATPPRLQECFDRAALVVGSPAPTGVGDVRGN